MSLLTRLSSLWHNLADKDLVEQELTEEVQVYLELLVEAKTKGGSSQKKLAARPWFNWVA